MNRRRFMQALGGAAAAPALLGGRAQAAQKAKRPNIIFVMVDDMGPQWTGCYGGEEIETPRLDELAAGGMRFTNAYSMPQCTPTRVTLLTGQYPWRHGWINHWDVPRWGVGYFDWKRNASFGNVMKSAGYATCCAGKWQVNDFRLEPEAMVKCGFDEYCMWTGYETGNPPSAERYWNPYLHTKDGSKTYKGQFGPTVVTDFICDFLKRHRDEPMMVYYPMILTHGPYTDTPLERDVGKDKKKLFQVMVRYVDHLVGRIVATLDELKIRDNTILIFTTDNGGGPTTPIKGRGIAGGKGRTTENGVCEPFIVNGPGLVPKGVVTDALTDFTDMLPTFAELGGAKLPKQKVDGVSIAPLLLGQAKDSPREWIMAMGGGAGGVGPDGRVTNKHEYRDRVIRDKQYKLWIDTKRQSVRLHDLQADPYEEKNLIDSDDPRVVAARKKLEAVAATFPEKDPSPIYTPRKANSWDRKVSGAKAEKRTKQKNKKPRAERKKKA